MKAAQLQMQNNKESEIEVKLDKIANLLELLVEMQGKEVFYPPESKIKKSFLKECTEILKGIKNGKIKTRGRSRAVRFLGPFRLPFC